MVVRDTTRDTAIAALNVTANSRKSLPTIPAIIKIGMKTATSEVLMEITVKPISREPCSAAAKWLHSAFKMTRDIFDDDDGVVDDEARGDRKRHQRKIVERVSGKYMMPNVPTSESGTAMLGMMVAQTFRKNAKTTRITRAIEINRVISTS